MAVRKSKEESFSVSGNSDQWFTKTENALTKGGFTNIKANKLLNQITGDYKKVTVWGEISVTLFPKNEQIEINVKSTANTDNIFAMFSSPTQKILDQFKNNI
nr:hypothetical protein [uncultured Flavobacterium sp.]